MTTKSPPRGQAETEATPPPEVDPRPPGPLESNGGRGPKLLNQLRGRATSGLSTDEILALTRY